MEPRRARTPAAAGRASVARRAAPRRSPVITLDPPRAGSLRWPLRAATAMISALSCYIVLSAGGRSQGFVLIGFAIISTTIVLWWSERRTRLHARAIGTSPASASRGSRPRTSRPCATSSASARSCSTPPRRSPSSASVTPSSTPALRRAPLGLPHRPVPQRRLYSLVHPQDAPRLRDFLRELAAAPGAHRRVEFRLLHEHGDWRYIEAVATNLLDNRDIGGIVLNSRDTTERK